MMEEENMKVLHLVLYSTTDPEYAAMYHHTRYWYQQFADVGVDTFYYTYDEKVSEITVDAATRIIRLPGKESPHGILQKTIDVLQYFASSGYEFVIRSNVSTVINLPKLLSTLSDKHNPEVNLYAGTHLMVAENVESKKDPAVQKMGPLTFVQGTCIVLSAASLKLLLNNNGLLVEDLVADVSLGLFFKRQGINPVLIGKQFLKIKSSYNVDSVTAFRNHQHDRKEDTKNVRWIVKSLWQRYIDMKNPLLVHRVFYYNIDVTQKIQEFCAQDPKRRWVTDQDNAKLDKLFGDPCQDVCKTLHIEYAQQDLPAFTQCATLAFEISPNNKKLMVR